MKNPTEISHDLRTPLTSIRLVIDLCLRRGDVLDPDELKELLGRALEQTKKLEGAIVEAEREALTSFVHEEDNVIVLHEESIGTVRVLGPRSSSRSRSGVGGGT